MRLGGRIGLARFLARGMVGCAALSVVVGGVGDVAAAQMQAVQAARGLWGIVRTPDGHEHVVRGLAAAEAIRDNELGRTSTRVMSFERDEPVHLLWTNDPYRPQQWALNEVSYEQSWPISTGAGVTVAVIDTGVLGTHQDLIGSVVPGVDYASDAATVDPAGNGEVDPGGHGTHVAGIIAAHANNGVGIAGAAPGAKIMPIRVLDASGSGSTSAVADGIIYAADHGARVINLSLGGPGVSPTMETAMQYALSKQVVVFAAAGNSYTDGSPATYPAAYPEAIAVGAVDSTLHHAYFSNADPYVGVVAPGAGIWSLWGQGTRQYADMDGTSMATPYAAATAALVLGENPHLSAQQLTNVIEGTATPLGAPSASDPCHPAPRNCYGHGLVNPRAALLAASPLRINQGTKGNGYWVVTATGRVQAFGKAHFFGDLRGVHLSAPIVASARTPSGNGYWLAGSDGAVYAFGDAHYLGSMQGHRLNDPIVGMAAMPKGEGYVLLGRDGGIFTFGTAGFYGSTGNIHLNAPVLDLTMTADGLGYWFVAADGGVFSYGDARFHGSTASIKLVRPVRSMSASRNGSGYWMVADDGGIFAFDVPFEGSLPTVRALFGLPYVTSVRMRSLPSNDGYYILGVDGTVSAFGNAKFWGSGNAGWSVDLMQMP